MLKKVGFNQGMSFEAKIQENVDLALGDGTYESGRLNARLSCVYYAAYLSAKCFLLGKGVSSDNYGSKLATFGLSYREGKNNPFGHDTIWLLLNKMAEDKDLAERAKLSGLGKSLHDLRIQADYYPAMTAEWEFKNGLRIADEIMEILGKSYELLDNCN